MAKRLSSMDVTLRGVTRTFEFDPPTPVESDDEGDASMEVLADAETTEVVLTGGVSSAQVTVSFTLQLEGTINVELTDLEEVEDEDDVISAVERGDFDEVGYAIEQWVANNTDSSDAQIDNVDVDGLYDDDGDLVD